MNETTTLTIDLPISDRFLFDVFTTALEGGIGYWSECTAYHIWKDAAYTPDLDGFYADIVETEPARTDERESFRIDRTTILVGLNRVLMRRIGLVNPDAELIALAKGIIEDDAGEIDADVADVIVQAGLYDEIIYG